MAWKIERWLSQLYPGDNSCLTTPYAKLTPREFVVVACSTLDAGVAEVIALRLRDDPKEVEDLLGADGDGRAPVGSFGARIQLAYLLGLLNKTQAQGFRALKNLRNVMAHRVMVDLTCSDAQRCLEPIRAHWQRLVASENHMFEALKPLIDDSRRSEKAAMRMLRFHFSLCQIALRQVHDRMERLEAIDEILLGQGRRRTRS